MTMLVEILHQTIKVSLHYLLTTLSIKISKSLDEVLLQVCACIVPSQLANTNVDTVDVSHHLVVDFF